MSRAMAIIMALMVCGLAAAAELHVPAQYGTIQAAVDAASDGDEVIVSPGTYTGGVDSVVNLVGKSITLRASGTPEATVIDGENLRRGFYINGGSAIVDGFTITRGYAPGEDTYPFENYGGGVYCWSGSPTITNCIISGNTAAENGDINSAGGGIFFTTLSSPTITDCVISNNTATSGGGITGVVSSGSIPTITDCVISNNTASGGLGGGVYVGECAITGCTISGNTAALFGGGIYFIGDDQALTGCTITDNTAPYGGGINCSQAGPTLTDTVVCGNTSDQIRGSWTDGGGNTIAEICPWYQGACCIGQSCSVTTEANCSGDYLGDGTNCDGNPCYVPPTGACCINESCTVTTEAACSGDWLGEGGSCDDCTPDCPDVSGDGFVAVHDLLAVLEAWYSDDPDADINDDGVVGMDDLAAVINAWGPCP